MKEKKYFNANDGEYVLSESSESTTFYDVLALSRMDKKVINISDDELRLVTSKLYHAIKQAKNEPFEHVNISSYNSECGTVIKIVATKMS